MIKKIIDWFKKIISFFEQIEELEEDLTKIDKDINEEIKPQINNDPVVVVELPPKKKKKNTKKTFEVFPKVLYGIDTSTKIPGAPNFTYAELIKSETAERLKIKNVPTKSQLKNLVTVAKKCMQPIRDKFGKIIVTSGFRCPELCLKVGSSVNSNHTRGEAVDFYVYDKNVKLIDVVSWIYKNLEFRELILELGNKRDKRSPLIIHIAYRTNGNIKQIKHPITYKPISLQELKQYLKDLK